MNAISLTSHHSKVYLTLTLTDDFELGTKGKVLPQGIHM